MSGLPLGASGTTLLFHCYSSLSAGPEPNKPLVHLMGARSSPKKTFRHVFHFTVAGQSLGHGVFIGGRINNALCKSTRRQFGTQRDETQCSATLSDHIIQQVADTGAGGHRHWASTSHPHLKPVPSVLRPPLVSIVLPLASH